MTRNILFADYLESRLPQGLAARVHHLSTRPIACAPLLAAAPSHSAEKTYCESHFLVITQPKQTPAPEAEEPNQLIVLGVEVLIFTSTSLTTVFVSKADSTGFLVKSADPIHHVSLPRTVIESFLSFLTGPRKQGPRLVLSLFARSQNQYLFPGSIENPRKHVLDDRKLIKWWCGTIDPLLQRDDQPAGVDAASTTFSLPAVQAYVIVPGCDASETKAFFPDSARADPRSRPRWISRYPVELLANDSARPVRCLVPRLPDDPKARFLDDLDEGQIAETGAWRDIKTLDQFWELMSYRQECSAGRLVGFIWMVFPCVEVLQSGVKSSLTGPIETTEVLSSNGRKSQTQNGLHPWPTDLTSDATLITMEQEEPKTKPMLKAEQMVKHITAKVAIPKHETEVNGVEPFISWPESTRGQLILESTSYSALMDHLLDLDFAGEDNAVTSTRSWVSKAESLSGKSEFGVAIKGESTSTRPNNITKMPVVAANIITAVRKKRKANAVESTNDTQRPAGSNEMEHDSKKARSLV